MSISDHWLVVLAIVCFVIASYPPSKIPVRFEFLAFALLAATLL